MDVYEKTILLVDLRNEYCQLSHGPYDARENPGDHTVQTFKRSSDPTF